MIPFGVAAGAASSALQTFFGKIPVWMRWTLIGLVAALAGFLLHQHVAHKAIAAAEKRGSDAAYANVAAKAVKIEKQMNDLNRSIAAAIREKNDETNRRIARDADVVRVYGPGKARCGPAGLARAPGGHVAADGSGDGTMAPLPSTEGIDLIGLPFAATVDFAEQADLNRAEVISWREWWKRFDAQWKQYQAEAAKARQPAK